MATITTNGIVAFSQTDFTEILAFIKQPSASPRREAALV